MTETIRHGVPNHQIGAPRSNGVSLSASQCLGCAFPSSCLILWHVAGARPVARWIARTETPTSPAKIASHSDGSGISEVCSRSPAVRLPAPRASHRAGVRYHCRDHFVGCLVSLVGVEAHDGHAMNHEQSLSTIILYRSGGRMPLRAIHLDGNPNPVDIDEQVHLKGPTTRAEPESPSSVRNDPDTVLVERLGEPILAD